MKRAVCILLLTFLSISTLFAAGDLSLKTVVIDPGHGGKDAGCVSKDRKTYEKNLVLEISRKLEARIKENYPEVKVILTRTKDEFIELKDRAEKANDANANLFISIHINSTTGTSANGYSVHVLGQSSVKNRDLFAYNMDVCKRENSVILLEDDYSTKYQGFNPNDQESFIFMQLMQNSNLEQSLKLASLIEENLKGGPIKADRGIWQNPFYVLWRTAMPSVLVELGFISNANDLAALRIEENRDNLANALYNAFAQYKYEYDASMNVAKGSAPAKLPVKTVTAPAETPAPAEAKEAPKEAAAAEQGTLYGVQIFAGSRKLSAKDPQFLGYEPKVIQGASIYKYIIGVRPTLEQTRAEYEKIRKKYPQSFVVKIEGEVISRL